MFGRHMRLGTLVEDKGHTELPVFHVEAGKEIFSVAKSPLKKFSFFLSGLVKTGMSFYGFPVVFCVLNVVGCRGNEMSAVAHRYSKLQSQN